MSNQIAGRVRILNTNLLMIDTFLIKFQFTALSQNWQVGWYLCVCIQILKSSLYKALVSLCFYFLQGKKSEGAPVAFDTFSRIFGESKEKVSKLYQPPSSRLLLNLSQQTREGFISIHFFLKKTQKTQQSKYFLFQFSSLCLVDEKKNKRE